MRERKVESEKTSSAGALRRSHTNSYSVSRGISVSLSRPLPVSCTHTLTHSQTEDPGRGWAEYSAQRPPLANLERYRGAKIGAPSHDIDKDLLCILSLTRPRRTPPSLHKQKRISWMGHKSSSLRCRSRSNLGSRFCFTPPSAPARHTISSLHTVRSTVNPAAH